MAISVCVDPNIISLGSALFANVPFVGRYAQMTNKFQIQQSDQCNLAGIFRLARLRLATDP